ncbi:glutamate--tRNA ligase [Segnochrobactraceae bacterium EtOH-i3]
MSATVRFAPSPTGFLHVGNARTLVLNALFARQTGGRFILRLDDTDRERSTPEFADAIVSDLAWLGIVPDRIVRQSDRAPEHRSAAERLKAAGLLYPCYETPEDLEYKRRRQRAKGLPPVYDRAALKMTPGGRAVLEADGRKPHWRFRLPNFTSDPFHPESTIVSWTDLVRGPQSVDLATLSDPVLVRGDGSFLYTLPSVVDDIELAISHVIRGDDHVTNTGVQIALFQALGAAVPQFGHHNLLVLADGSALSKRTGALSLKSLREEGIEPMAVASLAALIGSADRVEPLPDLDSLASHLHLDHISRAPARFDPHELETLTHHLLKNRPFAAVAGRLAALGVPGGAEFWEAVRGNLHDLAEAADWWAIVSGPPPALGAPLAEADRAVLTAAIGLLPETPPDSATYGAWTRAIAAATGAKGRALHHPLRLVLTGREAGPELARLLPLIGRARVLERLEKAALAVAGA